MGNDGDIDVTTTNTANTVYVGGLRGFVNGQINKNGSVLNYNKGNVSVTTSAKTTYVGGVASLDGATSVRASNSGNVTYTYTGEASTAVKVYASLGIASRSGSTATEEGTYSGTVTLNNTSGITANCGLLYGYVKSACGSKLNAINIKKGTTINGVTVSDVETDPGYYKNMSYLYGASTPSDAVFTITSLNLVD
jgi:hypothetical protein